VNIKYLGQEISDDELKKIGSKAFHLHQLRKAGFSVPSGFVITKQDVNLREAIESIGGFPVAVRSSCSMEDMPNASFAGLYETFLYVRDLEDLERNVHDCFESRKSKRVEDYLKHKGINARATDLSMSVLVQKMIDPVIAGVLFTINPQNGYEEEFYLEYCQGVGERLVSGLVTPSSVTFDIQKDLIVEHNINDERTEISYQLLKLLVNQAKKIQAYFGLPQDIEWAIDHSGILHILQSRPITTLNFRSDVPELTNADLKDGGISARVCTPLMFSAYRNALQFSMADYFKRINLIKNADDIKWIYSFYGRAYWNAGAVKEGLKSIPGFNENDFDRDLGIQKDYGLKGPVKTPFNLSSLTQAIPIMIGLYGEFRDCEIMIDQFRDSFNQRDKILKDKLKDLSRLDDSKFYTWLAEVIQFQKTTERNYFRTIYNNSNFQTEFKTKLKKLKNYHKGDEIELMSSLEGVSHLNVQEDLGELASISDLYGLDSQIYYESREKFLIKHYHHGPAELDLTVARWGERKDWVDDLVRSFQESTKQSSVEFEKTKSRLILGLNYFAKNSFLKMLERSRHFLKMREEMRSYSTRAYYLLRLGLLEFSRRKSLNELDIFMFDLNEVLQFTIGEMKDLPSIQERILHFQGYRYFQSPNEFGGKILQSLNDYAATGLRGLGCSAGEKVGRARIILDIHQTYHLTKDDILVTLFTDPGWTPVLARVGGVITEVGGLLSHAAVIGREYGIPAILNLTKATQLIQDGSLIKINGKNGTVEILEEGP
jgi:phosphohistidine swiveling domain-containing protein